MEKSKQEIITVENSDQVKFDTKVNALMADGFMLHSSDCGFADSEKYDYCSSYQAILYKPAESDSTLIADLVAGLEKADKMIAHVECPQCDGSGRFYDCNGMPAQCQWCDEHSQIKALIERAKH